MTKCVLTEAQQSWENLQFPVKDALRDYKDKEGRRWKSKLRDLWLSGLDTGHLRTIRNAIGPSGLDEIVL